MTMRNVEGVSHLGLYAIIAFLAVSCGIPIGGNQALNAPVPSGVVVSSGSFVGSDGVTVSGNAQIYNQSNGNYVLYLSGLSMSGLSTGSTSTSGLQVILAGGGQTLLTQALQGTSGSQAYPFTPSTTNFSNVSIYSSTANPAQNIAQANLVTTGN